MCIAVVDLAGAHGPLLTFGNKRINDLAFMRWVGSNGKKINMGLCLENPICPSMILPK
jgi:hypothetical protein